MTKSQPAPGRAGVRGESGGDATPEGEGRGDREGRGGLAQEVSPGRIARTSSLGPACQRLKGTILIDCDGGTPRGAGAPTLVSSLTRSRAGSESLSPQ